MPSKDTVILYHADCADGFSAAWAAWKKFGDRASYFAINHSDPPLNLKNKHIFFLDILYRERELEKLLSENKSVNIIDHHITNKGLLSLTSSYLFSISHSGAFLAWKYFHKKPMPKLISYIEDNDLWKFKLLHAKELSAYISTKKFGFIEWNKLAGEFEDRNARGRLIASGKVISDFERRNIEELASRAELVQFLGYEIPAVNAASFKGGLGNFLALKEPPFALVWSKERNIIKVSLRSIPKFDVSKLASHFPGGGGHKNAAGFSFPANKKLPWKSIKK